VRKKFWGVKMKNIIKMENSIIYDLSYSGVYPKYLGMNELAKIPHNIYKEKEIKNDLG